MVTKFAPRSATFLLNVMVSSIFKQKMKQIGKLGAHDIDFPLPPGFMDKVNSIEADIISKAYMELFKNLYSSFDVLQPDVKISIIEFDAKKGIAVFRFTNSIFMDGTEDFIYHLYFVCGIAEERIATALDLPVSVNIDKIHVDKKKEFSYYDLSIKAG